MRYIDIDDILGRGITFNVILGARGIGKTYGTLKYTLVNRLKLCYLRRTQAEIDKSCTEAINPYKKINTDMDMNISVKNAKELAYINDDSGACIGYGIALSTYGGIRGADLSDVDFIFFDEFNQPNRNRLKNEADLFYGLYETIVRNKEIEGGKPVQCILASNSDSLSNPILESLGVVGVIENMKAHGQQRYTDRERGLFIYLPANIPISKEKEKTALYKLTRNTAYSKMALENEFSYENFSNIIPKKPLMEYIPVCAYDDIYIYRHKSTPTFYVCSSYHDVNKFSADQKIGLLRLNLGLKMAYYDGGVFYESMYHKNKFIDIFT